MRRDYIAEQLARKVKRAIGNREKVEVGTVFDTGPGKLGGAPHYVKRIFHVAAVTGVPRQGFQVATNVREVMRKLVREVNAYNHKFGIRARDRVTSVLTPLFGTGIANRHPDSVTDMLIQGAIDGVNDAVVGRLKDPVRTVYFLAFTTRDLQALERSLARLADRFRGLGPEVTPS